MTSIPISPSAIAGALPYLTPQQALKLNICKIPKEDAAFVPMQFTFTNTASWLVDMSNGGPQGPVLSQIACMYIDASQSSHDINILFPDSGYQVRIGQGDGQLIPILTQGGAPPKFYVILDSSGATSATDVVNIFAVNQFIPEFVTNNSESFQNTLSYGYGSLFAPTPNFTQSNFYQANYSTGSGSTIVLIQAKEWFVTSIAISGRAMAGSGPIAYDIFFLDDIHSFLTFHDVLNTTLTALQIPPLNGLNYHSLGSGSLSVQIAPSSPLTGLSSLSINVFGGILVP